MNVDLNDVFSGVSAVGVVGGLLGVGLALRKSQRETKEEREKTQKAREVDAASHAETWTNLNRDVGELKEDVKDIKKTLGNGGYAGIKGDIQEIKSNCRFEMAILKQEVETNSPRICKLEDKVNELEKH